MTDKKTTSQASLKKNRRPYVFALQCLAGVAVIGSVAAFSQLAEPHAAVSRDVGTPETESYSISQLLQVAKAPIFSTGTTGNYLAGRYAANMGDFKNANLYLTRTLRQEPDNMEIAGYAYRMHLITGDMESAVEMAEMLYEAGDMESNPEVMVLLAHIKAGRYEQAREVAETFNRQGFNLIVLPLVSAWIEFAEGNLVKPVEQSESLKNIAEFAPFIYYQTALINDLAGFEDEALMQYNEALSLSKAMPYRVVEMLGNLHARRGEWDKAEALYSRYREQNPDSLLLTADSHFHANKEKAPARLVKSPREGVAEIFFSTASILHNEGLNEEALIYIQQVLYLNPAFTAAHLMRGTIYEDLKRYEDAVAEYDSLPSGTTYYYKGQLRKAYALNAMDKSKEALALLEKLSDKLPQRHQVHLTRGDILMRAKNYTEAASAYTSALSKIGDVEADHWPILYARGISYERSGEWGKAEVDLLKALEFEPGQPDVMNYLGYSWLTQKIRMDEARDLIEQAVEARPTDAHIIDSMGWALYTSGEYESAAQYLERAIELMPTDPTVNDHLGDVYWRLGRKTEARFQWKRALSFDPEPEQVKELTEKLAEGLPPVEHVQTAESDKKQQRVEVRQN